MTTGKAFLTLSSDTRGKKHSYQIVVISVSQGYNVQLDSNTTRSQKNYTARRVKENDLTFTIQCRNVKEYDALKIAIKVSQDAAIKTVTKGFVRFTYPDLKMDYLGFITNSPEGIDRFEYSPNLYITMQLVRDTINTVTTQYSLLDGKWTDIYGTSIADLYNKNGVISDVAGNPDGIMESNPPSTGGGGGGVRVRATQ